MAAYGAIQIPDAFQAVRGLDLVAEVTAHLATDPSGFRRLGLSLVGSGHELDFEYRSGSGEWDAPVEPGDRVQVRYDAFLDDLLPRQETHKRLALFDLEGRLLWLQYAHSNQRSLLELAALAGVRLSEARGSCFTEPRGREHLPLHGFSFAVQVPGSTPVKVSQGTTSTLRSGDWSGRLFVGSAFLRETECLLPGEWPENELTFAILADTLGSPTSCLGDGDCSDSQYCERGAGNCGDAGYCSPRPLTCMLPATQSAVCGCDGQVYEGPCLANKAGVDYDADLEGARCPTLYSCGPMSCRVGKEYCVAHDFESYRVFPACVTPPDPPQGCNPNAVTCACITDPACSCEMLVAGEVRVHCNHFQDRD